MPAMWAHPSWRHAQSGFTLLELLVVIAIMAALTAAFPLALNRFVPARRADAAARELLADIRLAQARSVAADRVVSIVPTTHGYDVMAAELAETRTLSARVWRESTRLVLRSLDDTRELTTFGVFPDGSTTGGRFLIRDGERVRSVTVSELTARVRIESGEPHAQVTP